MTDLTGARCIGQGTLMASTDPLDHAEAAKLCGAGTSDPCPAIGACGGMARGLQRGPLDSRPVGTWAGILYTGVKVPECSRGGAKPLPREHGTDRGYYQHRTHQEASCHDCKAAHKVAVWLRARACGERDDSTPVDSA